MIQILQVLIFIIFLIAIAILNEFMKSRGDKDLKNIMIAYFSCEIWKNIIGLLLISIYADELPLLAKIGILLMVVPKAGVKVWLFKYLIKTKK